MSSTTNASERGLGVALATLGAAGLYLVHLGIDSPLGSGATIVPLMTMSGVVVLGVLMAVRGGAMKSTLVSRGSTLRLASAIAVIVLHAALIRQLGFLLGAITMQMCLFYILNVRSLFTALTVSTLVSAAIYFGISWTFNVPLPSGTIF